MSENKIEKLKELREILVVRSDVSYENEKKYLKDDETIKAKIVKERGDTLFSVIKDIDKILSLEEKEDE